jgi:cystathionine beta-synthase
MARERKDQPCFCENILGTVGRTPLVKLNRVVAGACTCTVLAKVEFFNPGGSVKDRIGPAIIEDAERAGLLKPGGTIVEATSGNTGAGLALAAAVKGYRCVFVMPDKMSEEKVRFLRAFGARVIVTPTAVVPEDPRSYYNVAKRIVSETPNSILANQYHNPANPEAHYRTTGPELWEQTAGRIDVLVAGIGTGGTISGAGRYLKEQNPNVKLVGVDILGSLLYDTWKLCRVPEDPYLRTYKVEGIGEDFVPSTLDLSLLDEVVQVDDRESFVMARRLVREEGIFCGGSSGSAVAGLLKSTIVRALELGRTTVVLLPDSGNRYLSKFYDDNWMRENGFMPSVWSEETVADVLNSRKRFDLVTARPDDRMTTVVARMKEFDISQVPVVDAGDNLVGIVTEVDLLEHLLHPGHEHDPAETIASIVDPHVLSAPASASVESVLTAFERGKVIVVVDDNRPVGILTKIDLIDHMAGRIR